MIWPLKDNVDKVELSFVGLVVLGKLLTLLAIFLGFFGDSILFTILNVIFIILSVPLVLAPLFFYMAAGLGFFRRRAMLVTLSGIEIFEGAMSFPLGFSVFDTPDTIGAFSKLGKLVHLVEPGSDFFYFALFSSLISLGVTYFFIRHYREKTFEVSTSTQSSLLRFIAFFAGHAFAFLIIIPLYLYLSASYIVSTISRGFFELEGLELKSVERIYTKGDKKLSLIPMMHVGEKGFYKKVADSYKEKGTLIIREGVSDKNKRIKHDGSHSKISSLLGLSTQADELKVKESEGISIISGDIDASQFSDRTLEILNLALKINENLDKPASFADDYFRLDKLLSTQEDRDAFYHELIMLRNEALLKAFDQNQAKYGRVVIPWGALHMPSLEEEFKKRGFQLVESSKRTVVYFLRK